MSAREDFIAGGRVVSPMLLGVLPFGLIVGVTAVGAGISPLQALGLSTLIFAGASQLAAIELFARDAPVTVVVLTVVVINLRMMMYSASIAPYFRRLAAPTKWLAAYLLTDQAYAVSITEFRQTAPDERSRKWYYFGAAVTLWVPWQIVTLVGAFVGASVPEGLSLEFAIPLTFMALLFPTLDGRSTEVAALVGGGVGVVAAVLPYNLGLVTAAVLGVVAGVVHELFRGEFPTTDGAAHGHGDESGGDSA